MVTAAEIRCLGGRGGLMRRYVRESKRVTVVFEPTGEEVVVCARLREWRVEIILDVGGWRF